jgi:hypothetical protein
METHCELFAVVLFSLLLGLLLLSGLGISLLTTNSNNAEK